MGEADAGWWRIARAEQAAVLVDADEYFRAARAAMLKARRRIMLIGWDFDARIRLDDRERLPGEPREVGGFIGWLIRRAPDLEVQLLRWDKGALKTLIRPSTMLTLARWMFLDRRIHSRLDGFHPTGASHHQKIIVIDDCLAFCGGIDMTGDRWDTRGHVHGDPRRRRPNGRPYKPWHDASMMVSGPAAASLGELARMRWEHAGGPALDPVTDGRDCWPAHVTPDFVEADIAVARTRAAMPGCEAIHEVEALFLRQIAAARRHVYVESQYFASRRIAEAIARRLDEADGPEFIIVNPVTAQGWLEPIAMDSARARLVEALRRHDRNGRFAMYHSMTSEGAPIYTHAKILIVDERVLRVGSSNMNNRSLRLDTECDLSLDVALPANAGAGAAIRRIRDGLIAEHLGLSPGEVGGRIDATGSLIATIEGLRGKGRTLVPYRAAGLGAVSKWLADNEVLDPESPAEMFEPLSRRSLFRRRLRKPPD